MLKVDVWESQKISEVEPKLRVAVRPLQSRVSKFRLSSRRPDFDFGGQTTTISAMRIIYWSAVLTQSAG
jgi:hypothetical protein